MADSELETRARQYADLHGLGIDFTKPLGYGQDGIVWRTDRRTAVKCFGRPSNYLRELKCYRRLESRHVTEICGFAVPRLVSSDDHLLVIEMDIVSPPFILDFGKAYLDSAPEHSPEVMEYCAAEQLEWWGEERFSQVQLLLWRLWDEFGIHYPDPRPGNIMFEDMGD